jgi:hypothetical protein
VNGTVVSQKEFRAFLETAYPTMRNDNADARPGARQRLLRSCLDLRVLAKKGRQAGLLTTPEFAKRRAEITRMTSPSP